MIETYEYGNGLVVHVDYDESAVNPHDDIDCEFSGICRNDRNSIESDRYGIMADYDRLIDDMDTAEYNDDAESLAELTEQKESYAEFFLKAWHEYGWPEFRIVINTDKATAITGFKPTADMSWEQWAQGIVDTYAAYTEGSVYSITAEYPNGDTESICGVYTADSGSPDKDECAEYADDMEPNGAYDIDPDDSPAATYSVQQIRDAAARYGMSVPSASRFILALNEVA